jgi:putative inorganic carbon (HCO3(-)) transporter
MMRDFSFTGIGLGTFEETVLSLYPLFVANPGAPQPHAHNLFLQMGVDFGIGGFVAFLGLVTVALVGGWQNIRRAEDATTQWLAIGLLAGILVFLLHSLLDAVFVSTKVSVVIWSMLGFLMALVGMQRAWR